MSNLTKIYLIYAPSVAEKLEQVTAHPVVIEAGIKIHLIKLEKFTAISAKMKAGHALIWLEQHHYPEVLRLAQATGLSIGFLPIAGEQPSQFLKNLDLPNKFDACLSLALADDPLYIDLIVCNGEVVTNGVNLENQTTMSEFIGESQKYSGIDKLKFKIKRTVHAFSLTPHPVTIITGKGKSVSTAITGMVLLDFHNSGMLAEWFRDSISLRDRRLSVALFAPQSIVSYILLSSQMLLSKQKNKLPQQLGYIRTASLTVRTPVDTHYLVNNKALTTRELIIETVSDGVKVNAGEKFRERQDFSDDKENVICDQLPQQEHRIKYLSKTLPFFSHALESDFKDLFLAMKDSATISSNFILLMVLSSMLAGLGLILNSPSIVIGAMVLAPLMAPIISLSLGLLRSDADLSRRSLFTVFIGMLVPLTLSALMAAVLPFQEITGEIEGRLNPTTLDLLVAVVSGIAGAFANTRENIAKSLPGVAIAVALVPPLCVSGIGIGWLDFEVFYGAMLLFLTNLTGIILAAGLTFMVIGFAPFARAKKGIAISMLLVSIISFPLILAFSDMQKVAEVKQQLRSEEYAIAGQRQQLRNIKVRLAEPMTVSADLFTTQLPDPQMLLLFEQHLSAMLKQKVIVDFTVRLVTDSHFEKG